jgi:hypothetical protein
MVFSRTLTSILLITALLFNSAGVVHAQISAPMIQAELNPDDFPVGGYAYEQGGVRVETLVGRYPQNGEDAVTSSLVADLEKDYAQNPNLVLETGYLQDATIRSPAQTDSSPGKKFVSFLKQKLSRSHHVPNKELGMELTSESQKDLKRKVSGWIQNRSEGFWMRLKVIFSGTVSVTVLIQTSPDLISAVGAGVAIVAASMVTARLSIQMNAFQNTVRIWNRSKKMKEVFLSAIDPEKQETLSSEERVKNRALVFIDEAHGFLNFGLTELAFDGALVAIKLGWTELLHVSGGNFELPNFLGGVAFATASQGVWERAVGQYIKLKKKEGLAPALYRTAVMRLQVVGSVMSVIGFTTFSSTVKLMGLPVPVGGFILASLGVGGVVYLRSLRKETLRTVAISINENACEDLLNPKSPDENSSRDSLWPRSNSFAQAW